MYEFFDHTADLGLRVQAHDLPQLFEDAARALTAAIVEAPPTGGSEVREFEITGDRHDHLLFDWLAELLWYFESERLVFGTFEVDVVDPPAGLRARAHGESFDPQKHRPLHEVKAITYHGLKVEPMGAEWLAEIIVDI